MRIVLIHPAGYNWMPGKRDVAAVANRMAPLGLLSIAAFLEREGHEVFIHDCLGPKAAPGIEKNAETICSYNPDLIGISATTSGFLDGYDLTRAVKKLMPHVEAIFGGVHVSALGSSLMENYPEIDYLSIGEGEMTMVELADGASPGSIAGLVWRDKDVIIENKPRLHLPDMDDFPFPAYEKLSGFPGGYNLPLFSFVKSPGATMITSRGCPYQCSYCDRSVFKKSFRFNSAEYIYEHMKYMRERFSVRHINIYDDLFTLKRKRITKLCNMLQDRPLGINFNCAVRVGYADDELLSMLKNAGALMVSIGIESADAAMLEKHKAGVRLDEVEDTVARIKSAGLRAKGLFMMGLPGETEESIKKTSDFIISLGLDDMNMSKFTPFPGAPIWSDIQKEGTLDIDWKKMNCLNFVFVPEAIKTRERLDELYNAHVKRFYSDPLWRKKFMKRLWQHRKSLAYLLRHLPSFLSAKRSFES